MQKIQKLDRDSDETLQLKTRGRSRFTVSRGRLTKMAAIRAMDHSTSLTTFSIVLRLTVISILMLALHPVGALRLYAFGTFSDNGEQWIDSEVTRALIPLYAIAVEHFNSRSGQVVPTLPARLLKCPSTRIELIKYIDDGGSPSMAMEALVQSLIRRNQFGEKMDGILGAYRNSITLALARAAGSMKVPIGSYGASLNSFSSVENYPTFFRTSPNDEAVAIAMADLFGKFGYTKLGMIYTDTSYGNAWKNALFKVCERNRDINLVTVFIESDQTSVDNAVRYLKKERINVIVYITSDNRNVGRLAKAAAKYDMLANKLWISNIPKYEHVTADNPGMEAELMNFFRGSIHIIPTIQGISNMSGIVETVRNVNWQALIQNIPTFNRSIIEQYLPTNILKGARFQLPPQLFTNPEPFSSTHWAWAYDSVLAYGLAACECASRGLSDGCSADPNGTDGLALHKTIKKLNFFGVSGHVAFLNNGDRDPTTCAYFLRNAQEVTMINPSTGENVTTLRNRNVGLWYPKSTLEPEELLTSTQAGYWQLTHNIKYGWNGSENPPMASDIPHHDEQTLPLWAKVIGIIEAILVILLVAWTILFIQVNSSNKLLIKSQPHFLILASIGCAMMGLSIIALTVEDDLSCMAFPWLFGTGMTLALSAIAVKSWRVYRLWNNRRPQAKKSQRGRKYMVFVAAIVLVEVALLIAWTAVAPLRYVREVVVQSESGYPIISQGICIGTSDASVIFAGIIVGLIVLVTLATVYASYLVRNAPEDFQEATSTLVAGVGLLGLYMLGIPASIALYSNTIGHFLTFSSVAFFTACGVILAVFVPRLNAVRKLYILQEQSRLSSSCDRNTLQSIQNVGGRMGAEKTSFQQAPPAATTPAPAPNENGSGAEKTPTSSKFKLTLESFLPRYTVEYASEEKPLDYSDRVLRYPRSTAQAMHEPTEDYESVFVIPEGDEDAENNEEEDEVERKLRRKPKPGITEKERTEGSSLENRSTLTQV